MPSPQRLLLRLLVPLGIAVFAALKCAGPGTLIFPLTAQLAQPLICSPRTTLVRAEQPATDSDGNRVTYVSLNCVGDNNFRQSADGRAFLVLGGIYFVPYSAAAVAAAFLIRLSSRGGAPPGPLGIESLRQVETLLAQNRKLDAIRVVQQYTGTNPRQAKGYVDTLAAPPPASSY
jgi:hypothetical protein